MQATNQDEHEALLQFLYLAPVGLVQILADGEITMVNPLCAQLLMPLSRDGSLDNLFTALEDVAPDLRRMTRQFGARNGTVCDSMHIHVDTVRSGRKDTQVLSLTLLKLKEDRFMAVLSDVTQVVRRERELRQSQGWIHTVLTGLNDYGLVRLDKDGHCREMYPGVKRVTGFTSEAIDGRNYALFYPPGGIDTIRAADRLREAEQSGWSLDEGWRQHEDGSRYWGSCLITPTHEPDQPSSSPDDAYTLIIRDISDRREAANAMRRSLCSDDLTGLLNRRVLFETAEMELQRWRRTPHPLSMVVIDADNFKQINDRYGHPAGDAVLRHVATALASSFGANDTVARLGGEEFVVLLPGVGLEEATCAVEHFCRTVESQPVYVGDHVIRYTVSAGVAVMEPALDNVDGLLQRADTAMYVAKARGRNQVVRWQPDL